MSTNPTSFTNPFFSYIPPTSSSSSSSSQRPTKPPNVDIDDSNVPLAPDFSSLPPSPVSAENLPPPPRNSLSLIEKSSPNQESSSSSSSSSFVSNLTVNKSNTSSSSGSYIDSNEFYFEYLQNEYLPNIKNSPPSTISSINSNSNSGNSNSNKIFTPTEVDFNKFFGTEPFEKASNNPSSGPSSSSSSSSSSSTSSSSSIPFQDDSRYNNPNDFYAIAFRLTQAKEKEQNSSSSSSSSSSSPLPQESSVLKATTTSSSSSSTSTFTEDVKLSKQPSSSSSTSSSSSSSSTSSSTPSRPSSSWFSFKPLSSLLKKLDPFSYLDQPVSDDSSSPSSSAPSAASSTVPSSSSSSSSSSIKATPISSSSSSVQDTAKKINYIIIASANNIENEENKKTFFNNLIEMANIYCKKNNIEDIKIAIIDLCNNKFSEEKVFLSSLKDKVSILALTVNLEFTSINQRLMFGTTALMNRLPKSLNLTISRGEGIQEENLKKITEKLSTSIIPSMCIYSILDKKTIGQLTLETANDIFEICTNKDKYLINKTWANFEKWMDNNKRMEYFYNFPALPQIKNFDEVKKAWESNQYSFTENNINNAIKSLFNFIIKEVNEAQAPTLTEDQLNDLINQNAELKECIYKQ